MTSAALARLLDSSLFSLVEDAFEDLPATGVLREGPAPTAVHRRLEVGLLEPARAFLERPSKGFRAGVVEAAFRLAGGGAPPPELGAMVELIHAGSLVIDDIQDGSTTRRGGPALHLEVGLPIAINTANWMYFAPLHWLPRLRLPPERELALHRLVAATMVRCHQGQALDLSVRVFELEQREVAEVVGFAIRLKTGSLVELAAVVGAIAGGGSREVVAALGELGAAIGIGLQQLDDLGAVRAPARRDKGREDARLGRPTWPWALAAESLAPDEWARLARLGAAATQGEVEPLLLELARGVTGPARRRISEGLATALARLETRLGPAADRGALARLEHELARLEASYG